MNPVIERLQKIESLMLTRLSYPGCTSKQLQGNLSAMKNIFFTFTYILILVSGCLIFAPELSIIIGYGLTLMTLLALSFSLQLIFPRHFLFIGLSHGLALNLATFYCILKMGGIPASGGLIFVGIANVLSTVPRQKAWYSITLFSIYLVLVVLLVVLKPWLYPSQLIKPFENTVLYMLNAIFLTGASLIFVLDFIRQQRKLDVIETNHLKEIHEMKNRLYTNITHEFRTPLTVIQGMTDLIRTQPEQWMETGLLKIRANSDILLHLVNQMLCMARIETGAVTISLCRKDIINNLYSLVEQFKPEAITRKIDLTFEPEEASFNMDFDEKKLMHIMSNLISNALKFTAEGGRVKVEANGHEDAEQFAIRVKDTGIGIRKEDMDHLFDRFYQVENNNSPGGSGLGLAVVKDAVELLKGTISVTSIPGIGTEFSVFLPVTRNAPETDIRQDADETEETRQQANGDWSASLIFRDASPEVVQEEAVMQDGAPLLLIVEDNLDLVEYLRAILQKKYHVEVAENGSTGFEKALNLVPEIILSDVMMPVLDGIAMLEKLKNDIRTSHIPVVMLTAKADIDSRLAGLERGADAYLAKPFDEKELFIQLKNLVDQRKKLHERYSSIEKIPATSDIYLKKEDEFMIRVRQVLEANLENEEFGITQLCNELAVSRGQLYQKFKSLSNKTIADYFKFLRLQKAKELLLTTSLNVTEVTFAVGFKNLSHFSREFTRQFGKSPGKFRKP